MRGCSHSHVPLPPGRFEQITNGIAYLSLRLPRAGPKSTLQAANKLPHSALSMLGGTGGGRDRWRREVMVDLEVRTLRLYQ